MLSNNWMYLLDFKKEQKSNEILLVDTNMMAYIRLLQ